MLLVANLSLGDKRIDEKLTFESYIYWSGDVSAAFNDEANLNLYDRDFVEQWQNRPWTEKLWEHTMGLFSSQL